MLQFSQGLAHLGHLCTQTRHHLAPLQQVSWNCRLQGHGRPIGLQMIDCGPEANASPDAQASAGRKIKTVLSQAALHRTTALPSFRLTMIKAMQIVMQSFNVMQRSRVPCPAQTHTFCNNLSLILWVSEGISTCNGLRFLKRMQQLQHSSKGPQVERAPAASTQHTAASSFQCQMHRVQPADFQGLTPALVESCGAGPESHGQNGLALCSQMLMQV